MRFFSILFLISAIHGAFLIVIMLAHNRKQINENIFLVLLLSIVSGYQLREFIILEGHFATFPHMMAVFVPLLYLLGPIYFFYIKFVIYNETKLSKKDLLHLIPAFVCFLTILPFYVKTGAEKLALYHAPNPESLQLAPNRALYYGLMFLSAFLYCWKSLSLIHNKYQSFDGRTLKSIRIKLKWLKYYTWSFLFFLFCFLLAQLIFIFTDFYQYYVMLYTILASSVLIHFVGYWAVKESRITNDETSKPNRSPLPENRIADLKNKMTIILEKEKIYLDSDLSAKDICNRLSINSKYLSQTINSEFKCSLTYLINSYRIEKAKKMIISKEYNHLNFFGIAIDVGFNTKNTFTRTFKRHTGKTPSQFKIDEAHNSITSDNR